MTALQYSTLGVGNAEIRLLDIAPGDGDEEICCSLSVVSLNSHPQFEALSYVWGDDSIKKDVTVDGSYHPVTVNLESALRDLRSPSKRRTMWVDAICINQVDLTEKNHQIPLMGDIYRKASGVVAYLGHSNPHLEQFLDWSQAYSRKWPLLSSRRWIRMTLRSWSPQKGVREKDILSLETFLGLFEFASHPYFSRMWTFQEFLLPSRRPILALGKKSFQIDHISTQTWKSLHDRHFKMASKARGRLLRARGIEPEAQELLHLCQARFAQVIRDFDLTPNLVYMGHMWARPFKFDLSKLFIMTIHRKCLEPRDKIFALHPFIQELVPEICAPDYSKSPDKVLLETLSKFHQSSPFRTQVFMNYWPIRASGVEDASFPSWLPDITATGFPFIMDQGLESTTLRISEDFLILTLGACFIGKCRPPLIRLGTDPEEIVRRIAGLMYSDGEDLHSLAGSKIRMRRKKHDPERIFNALWTWIPLGQSRKDLRLILSICSTIAQYKSIRKLDDIPFTAEQSKKLHILTFAAKVFANKAFFWTDTGLFGTCSERLQEGDTIVITSEFRRPIAVRTRLDPSGGPNHYYMVDWAYVDGLEGTTMDAQLMNEIQETPLSDIYIH
ncbi:unnamed protein product [Clonostachys solani]|uniref:Heterokaryon incompatibility domain-containing protein n=1 Tax=Clonostachys solani TaxID=160281 RepID=A0A9P0ET45_9HYPO|nr:unnamed protein product [Clonostachys solani]